MARVGIVKKHMFDTFAKGLRADGRDFVSFRDVTVEYGISPKSAEGSARVRIGDTEVVAGVKLGTMTPYPDKPSEGTLMVNAELTAMASPNYRLGPPSITAIEMSRVIDRGIRECHAVDFKKLCIRDGELVWSVIVDIYPINDAGNVFDAAALAAVAALQDARFPVLEGDDVNYEKRTKDALPLLHMPISVTVRKIGRQILVDPDFIEEEQVDARVTFAIIEDGRFCAMQKGGQGAVSLEDIDAMANLALERTKDLRGKLKK